jgi:hypothetical protein
MKNFIQKSFVVSLMVIPLLSHAGERDCGGGFIKAIEENYLDRGFTGLVVASGTTHPINESHNGRMLLRTNIQEGIPLVAFEKAKLMRTTLIAAFHAGNYVRFKSDTAISPYCWDVTQVRVCRDEASCN